MSQSPYILAVSSVKTNAGRSTTALALAWTFGRNGFRVLVVDGNQYPELVPGKSETGGPDLWKNVVLGSRKAGEAQEVGADLVIIDCPPLSHDRARGILRSADGVLISVFPILHSLSPIPQALETIAGLEGAKVVGWFAANCDRENPIHQDIEEKVRAQLAELSQLSSIPADGKLEAWRPLAGEDLPPGPGRDAYFKLCSAVVESILVSVASGEGGSGSRDGTRRRFAPSRPPTLKHGAPSTAPDPDSRPAASSATAVASDEPKKASAAYVLAVTAHKESAGSATAVLGLARAFGRMGRRVLIVDSRRDPADSPFAAGGPDKRLWDDVFAGSAADAAELGADVVLQSCPPMYFPKTMGMVDAADGVLLITPADPVAIVSLLGTACSWYEATEKKRAGQFVGISISRFRASDEDQKGAIEDLLKQSGTVPYVEPPIPWQRELEGWAEGDLRTPPSGAAMAAFERLAKSLDRLALGHEPPPPTPARSEPREPAKPKPRKSGPGPATAGGAGPAKAAPEKAVPAKAPKAAPKKIELAKTQPPEAAPAKTTPAKATPAKATPAKAAPAKATPPKATPAKATPAKLELAKAEPATVEPAKIASAGVPGREEPWRLIGVRGPRVALELVPLGGQVALGDVGEFFPESIREGTAAALLQSGLVHTVAGDGPRATEGAHLRPRSPVEPAFLAKVEPRPTDVALFEACRALVKGDSAQALAALRGQTQCPDARFLAGALGLVGGDADRAAEDLAVAVGQDRQLGRSLARLHLSVLVHVGYQNRVETHLGPNLQGALLLLVAAHLAQGDLAGALTQLECLVELDPEDPLVRLCQAELHLDRATPDDFKAINKTTIQLKSGTPFQIALLLCKAKALHRLGLTEAARKILGDALRPKKGSSRALRHALLYERALVLAGQGQEKRARHDLETLYAEDPGYGDVAERLGL